MKQSAATSGATEGEPQGFSKITAAQSKRRINPEMPEYVSTVILALSVLKFGYRPLHNSQGDMDSQLKSAALLDVHPGFNRPITASPAVNPVQFFGLSFAVNDWLPRKAARHIKVTPHFHTINLRLRPTISKRDAGSIQQRLGDHGVSRLQGVLPERISITAPGRA